MDLYVTHKIQYLYASQKGVTFTLDFKRITRGFLDLQPSGSYGTATLPLDTTTVSLKGVGLYDFA
ncbi:MAG: hypothetical protein ACREA8_08300 [Nitrosotalea sp.]